MPLLFSLRVTRARPERDPERASEPGRFGPCRRLRVASIAGPSGLPSVAVLVLICALARVWPERDPERVCFGPYQRLCAASVLGPSGIPSLFAGAAPAKLRAYLWALKSKIRARCFVSFLRVKLLHGPNCPLRQCVCVCMQHDATLGQRELLDDAVDVCYGRPFKSQEALLQGWGCQAFIGARCLRIPKPNSIVEAAIAVEKRVGRRDAKSPG